MDIVFELIKLSRPHQFIKNFFIFLPLLFGFQLTSPDLILALFPAFISFCLAASAQYAFNDIKDKDQDAVHPGKCRRPVASGRVSVKNAYLFFIFTQSAAFGISALLMNVNFLFCLIAYMILNLLYSSFLKRIAILDIISVALCYVLRVLAGAFVLKITPSHWLILMTFLLALFLALAKRRDDLVLIHNGRNTRQCIENYNFEFISSAMTVMASVTIVSYILYTVSAQVTAKHGTDQLYLTTFWVILGFLRYMQLTFVDQKSSSPTKLVLTDRFLQVVIACWIFTFITLLYLL